MINENELRKVDLNLLLTFSALMRARSVTGAASRLYLGQPAVSMALKRLREVFQDELFVREGRELQPTTRAITLFENIEPALKRIQLTLRQMSPFDPGESTIEFKLGMYDDMEMALIPSLVSKLAVIAPGIDITIRRADNMHVEQMLASGEIDLAIAHFDNLPKWVAQETIDQVSFVVVYDDCTTDFSKPMTLEEFIRANHVLTSFSGERVGQIDFALKAIGRRRIVRLVTPHFASVPYFLKGTEYVACLPTHVAERCAQTFGLSYCPVPINHMPVDIFISWHRRYSPDPAHKWMRLQIRAAYEELMGK